MIKLLKYAKRYYGYIILAALSCVGASLTTVLLTNLLKVMIDSISQGRFAAIIGECAVKMLFILALGMLSNYLVVYATGYIGSGLLRDLREDCVNSLIKASPDYMNNHNYGDVMERVSSDTEVLADFMQGYFKDCIYVPIMVIVYSAYLIQINALLGLLCLIPLILLVPINVKYMKPIKLRQFEYNKKLGLTNNNISEAFAGAEVIKAYNLQKRMEDKYYKALKKTFDISSDTDLQQYHLEPFSRAIHEVPVAMALGVGDLMVLNTNISIGTLIVYINMVRKLVEPLGQVYQLVVRSQTAFVSVGRVFEIIDIPCERAVQNETDNAELEAFDIGNKNLFYNKTMPVIEFKNVSFRYCGEETGSSKKALDNISFSIQRGMRAAFVGKSGSGKSTILKLISRQLECKEGQIKYFGNDYSRITPENIRKREALVSQDTVLFPLSVADNIRVGNECASMEQIIEAAELADCDRFIKNMPKGFDSVLDEKGGNLSGGQRQRIGLARALIKDAEIYLFDEPTSALDSETERFICRAIKQLSKDKTVITVAHRLSTIIDYDVIYVIDGGKIAEYGSHKELMDKQGLYYSMYTEFCGVKA